MTRILYVFVIASSLALADPHIEVLVADDLKTATVTATGVGRALRGYSDTVWHNIDAVQNGDIRGRRLVVRSEPVSYRATVASPSGDRSRKRRRQTDWTDWLLLPENWHMTNPVTVVLRVPGEGAAILPFELVTHRPGHTVYRGYPLLPKLGGFSAFGDYTIQTLSIGDMTINTAIVGNTDHLDYASWTRLVVGAAQATHRTLPGTNALIVIVPLPLPKGTVPWAHVKRGGGSHIIAYANASSGLQELLHDWTLFHEVTHLYHPYMRDRDRWVSEGFASYFQNLYRARADLVTPRSAWELLSAGIERGRRENSKVGGVRVTRGGRMRTYWTRRRWHSMQTT